MDEDTAASKVLKNSEAEQSELDELLVKLATGGLSLSVAIGAFRSGEQTDWLKISWFVFLVCVVAVVASKFASVAAHRKRFQTLTHDDPARRSDLGGSALDRVVGSLNGLAGVAFFVGAALTVLHVLNVQ